MSNFNLAAEWISLNVGGKIFVTTKQTLCIDKESMLARMFSAEENGLSAGRKDPNNNYLIDRSPKYFGPILNFLRTGKVIIDEGVSIEGVIEEAHFFQIKGMIEQLSQMPDFTRKEVIKHARCNPAMLERIRLIGVDLSDLNLNGMSFDQSNITGANFTSSNIEASTFTKVNGNHAIFTEVFGIKSFFRESQLQCINFERAVLTDSNFSGSDLREANFEKADCSRVLFQKANLSGISFRGAILRTAKMQESNLTGADLREAELKDCHFTSCDLREAKLDWDKVTHVFHAKVTRKEWDAIPLPVERKNSLGLFIVEENSPTQEERK
jgi:uncharacterized protein YjbI with pentapeptide repeats